MTQVPAGSAELPSALPCPIAGCRSPAQRRDKGWFCVRHDLNFHVDEFTPLEPSVDRVDTASEQHAICAHHPENRAVAECAGTGNYICALCAVDIDGATYSVQFLDSAAGEAVLSERFASSLPRPDRLVWHLLAFTLVFPITVIMLFLSFVWVPVAFIYWAKLIRMRQGNELYRRVVSGWKLPVMLAGLVIWAALGLLFWGNILLRAYPLFGA